MVKKGHTHLRIRTGKKHSRAFKTLTLKHSQISRKILKTLKTPLTSTPLILLSMDIWLVATSNQIVTGGSKLKQNLQKNKVVTRKTPFYLS